MTKMIAITLAALLGGCATSPLSLEGDGGTTPPTGIYRFSVGPATGNCTPPTVNAPFEAPRVYVDTSTPGTLTLAVPESTIPGNVVFSTRDLVGGRYDEHPDNCGASHELRLVVDTAGAGEITVTRTDVWGSVASVPSDACGPGLPAADCSTSAELDYALVEPCPLPCQVQIQLDVPSTDPAPPLACVCPDGGS